MEKIHQGIGFSAKVQVGASVGALLAAESDLYIVLRSPSTDNTANASTAQVSYSISSDGSSVEPTSLTIGMTAATTATLAIGAYCLEIYKQDKSQMLYYKADFAFCIPSSAGESGSTTPIDTNTDVPIPTEGDNGLTVQDVLDYIAEKATNEPLV